MTGNGTATKTCEVKLSRLTVHPRNPRTISPARMEQLQRTITAERDMLQARPVIALKDGTVIAGNQRLLAAQALGWDTIPAMFVDLDEERATRWMLLDNRAFGADDLDQAAVLLAELKEAGSDLDLTGFASDEVEKLLRSLRPARDPDETPPLPVGDPRSVRGEVYELGSHRLFCGDATVPASYEVLLQGVAPRVVFTDPPYGVEYDGGSKRQKELDGDEHGTSIYMDSVPLMALHATSDASFYIWYADLSIAAAAAAAAGLRVRCQIIWVKNQAQYFNNARYHGKHEPCIYAAKASGTAAWFGETNEVTVWEYDRARSNDLHPTQKPTGLAERAIMNSSEYGDAILDPFGGSGSTLIAAEMTGRRAFLMEIDPAYCDVIRDRYEAFVAE